MMNGQAALKNGQFLHFYAVIRKKRKNKMAEDAR